GLVTATEPDVKETNTYQIALGLFSVYETDPKRQSQPLTQECAHCTEQQMLDQVATTAVALVHTTPTMAIEQPPVLPYCRIQHEQFWKGILAGSGTGLALAGLAAGVDMAVNSGRIVDAPGQPGGQAQIPSLTSDWIWVGFAPMLLG